MSLLKLIFAMALKLASGFDSISLPVSSRRRWKYYLLMGLKVQVLKVLLEANRD